MSVIWLTGLPAAGKTTIAEVLQKDLSARGFATEVLDGDVIREILGNTGFSPEERDQHIRRVGFTASRLEAHGVIVIASLVSPQASSRDFVRRLCKNFIEVYVSTPLAVCEARDPKNLYKKARAGLISSFTGIDAPYEIPQMPELVIETTLISPAQASALILEKILSDGTSDSNKVELHAHTPS